MGGTMLVTRKKKISFGLFNVHRQVELEPDPPRNLKKKNLELLVLNWEELRLELDCRFYQIKKKT